MYLTRMMKVLPTPAGTRPGSSPGFAGGARGASGAAARFPEGARPLLVPVAAGSPRRGQGRRGARIRSPRPAAQPGPRPPPPMAAPGAAAQGTTAYHFVPASQPAWELLPHSSGRALGPKLKRK